MFKSMLRTIYGLGIAMVPSIYANTWPDSKEKTIAFVVAGVMIGIGAHGWD